MIQTKKRAKEPALKQKHKTIMTLNKTSIIALISLTTLACGGADFQQAGESDEDRFEELNEDVDSGEELDEDAGTGGEGGSGGTSTGNGGGTESGGTDSGGTASTGGTGNGGSGGEEPAGGSGGTGAEGGAGGTGAGGEGGSGGVPGPCVPKNCLTLAIEMTDGDIEAEACGVLLSDGCGNAIDCGGCSDPHEECGVGEVTGSTNQGITAEDGQENICNGGCTFLSSFSPCESDIYYMACYGSETAADTFVNPTSCENQGVTGQYTKWCCDPA